MRKTLTVMLMALLLGVLPLLCPLAGYAAPAETTAAEFPAEAILTVGEGLTPEELSFAFGTKKTLTLDVVNHGGAAAHDISLTPLFSNDAAVFPFKITRADWTQPLINASSEAVLPEDMDTDDLSAASGEHAKGFAAFVFDVRSDAPRGYYPLRFILQYTENGKLCTREIVLQVFISTSAMGRDKGTTPTPVTVDELQPEIECTTRPMEVMAGEPFTLTITITNPQADNVLSSLRLVASSVQEGIFLPVSGASTLFIDTLEPGESQQLTLDMNTPTDLPPQHYTLALKLEYADDTADLHTLEKIITLPVHQPTDLRLSEITLVPTTGIVDQPVNLMVNLYNSGTTQLNNVLVRLDSQSAVRGEDYFAGNMSPGAAGTMDILITPLRSGELPCKLLISYEDAMGRSCQLAKDFVLKAELAAVPSSSVMTPPAQTSRPADAKDRYPPWLLPVIIASSVFVLALIFVLVILLRLRNRRHIRKNMDRYLDEI